MRATCELFSRESVQTELGTTSPQFSRQSDPFSWRIGNQEQARTVADHFAFSVVSIARHRVALIEAKFTTRGTKAEIIPDRNAKWNRKFPEFPNFQKKGQPLEVD